MPRPSLRVFLLTTALACANMAHADENVMIVFDGSNSMWGQIDGTAKIEIARNVMDNLLGDWVDTREVGLMAYGHRRQGDCGDIEMLVTPGAEARETILDRIGSITPTGKTPLTDAVEQAATELAYTDQPATVVLISDGLESCERDPCALAAALEQGGVGFTAHVVGFGLGNEEDTASLACIAEETGGEYISASNAAELGDALAAVGTAVATVVPEPTPEPEPEPEPQAPDVTVAAPDSVVGGSDITVTWAPTVDKTDYITVVPVGTETGTLGNYTQIGERAEVSVTVPGTEGLYEVRYMQRSSKETLGTDVVEVTKPEVTLTAPDAIETGAEMRIAWTPTINPRDYVTIVPVGTEPGTLGTYRAVSRFTETNLTAPAETGLYEIRYVLNIDKMTVATLPLEVTGPQIVLQAPASADAGSDVEVSWSQAINPRDYINIVPVGTDEGVFGNYKQVRDTNTGTVKAPADPGMYELRYVLREGGKTLATQMIEVTEPQVTISGPESVATGARFEVTWNRAIHPQDYIAIVPAGSDDGTFGNYTSVREKSAATLTAQADPGLYELRYILREGNKTLASVPIEVTAAEVTISGPASVATGSRFDVSWTNTVSPQDYVAIVPAGADAGTFGNYTTVRDETTKALTAPSDPGLYELRYILREGNKTLASAPIEVASPEVTITAPETIRAGSKFDVAWTGTVNGQDYMNIVAAGSDEGAFGNYFAVRDKGTGALQAPADPGLYEIRYVLREGNKTLAAVMVEVTDPEVTISATDAVRAGDTLRVTWTGTVATQDYVTLVPMGTPDDKLGLYQQVRDRGERDFEAPPETGLYEVRYVLREGGRVLARQTVEVLPQDAALNTGATLVAPDSAAPGATVEVSWTVESDSADQRITVARGDQAIFTWISADKIIDDGPLQVTLPNDPGVYEIRFLDVSKQEVLSRHVIKVE